ncbi:MAG: XisI protein [Deltaproteobacteria bacterium]|nr:XisI protein [Deltaproteobacteria bacterium]
MDPLDTWRDELERILREHAAIPYANGEIHSEAVFDRRNDRYLLVDVGWRGGERVHGALVHVDIIAGRFWIQYDGTERGVAWELVAAGVPKDRIVLGFQPPEVRPHTEFAA